MPRRKAESSGSGSRVATLILAAGPSQRFGSCKALAAVGGNTLIRHMISIAQAVTPDDVFVITGAYHDVVAKHVGERARTVYNPNWEHGMGESLACGVSAVSKHYDGVLILLADQVALHSDHLKALMTRWEAHPERPACAYYEDEMGVPALFPKSYFPELMNLSGPYGAKRILREQDPETDTVAIPEAAIDVDTQADLERWAMPVS